MLTDDEILNLVRECDLDWHAGFSIGDEDNRYARLARAIEAALAAASQGEWVMVPREPTEAMCKAGWTPEDPTPFGIWALMIAAAPPCPVTTCRVDGPGTVTVTATGVMFESSEKVDVRAAQPSADLEHLRALLADSVQYVTDAGLRAAIHDAMGDGDDA